MKHTSIVSRRLSTRLIHLYNLANDNLNVDILDIMNSTKDCKCIDARDRVYAVVSLVNISASEDIGIKPDHKETTGQVYQDLTVHYIKCLESLNILMSSGLNKKPSEMSTWVTDWMFKNIPRLYTKGRASGHGKSKSR